MITAIECLPCFLRQTLDATRLAALNHESQERIIRKVLLLMAEMDLHQSPPEMAQQIHRIIREITGVEDPYKQVKEQLNKTAMNLYPELKDRVKSAKDPLMMAVRLAISGNAIDMGANGNLQDADVGKALKKALIEPFYGDVENFRRALDQAKSILYLADNTGEIVFDRILIEQISPDRVTLVVRGGPVINDATMADALFVGLDRFVKIIDNGSDAPGTLLSDCHEAFQHHFSQADMIIAKGQGNYESLSDVTGNLFFLFKVKCSVIGKYVDQPLGTQVLVQSKCPTKEF